MCIAFSSIGLCSSSERHAFESQPPESEAIRKRIKTIIPGFCAAELIRATPGVSSWPHPSVHPETRGLGTRLVPFDGPRSRSGREINKIEERRTISPADFLPSSLDSAISFDCDSPLPSIEPPVPRIYNRYLALSSGLLRVSLVTANWRWGNTRFVIFRIRMQRPRSSLESGNFLPLCTMNNIRLSASRF